MNVHVHIERLILDGLPLEWSQGPLVRAAIEQELTRLLAAHGLSDELRLGGAVPRVRAGALPLARESHPAGLGRQIARSVYRGIGGTR